MPFFITHNIISVAYTALCSSMSLQETELSKLWKTRTHSSTESGTSTAKKGGRSNSFDDHDEICEVCEKGGDLLCCDTCTLVFHLKCIRPKLSVVPKGHWSCPHCIIEVIIRIWTTYSSAAHLRNSCCEAIDLPCSLLSALNTNLTGSCRW